MQILHQDRYAKILYAPEIDQIEHHWSEESYEMTEEEFKDFQLKNLEIAREVTPKRLFVDSIHFKFTVVPEIQDWINQDLHPKFEKMGMKKIAFLMSKDFFAHFSIQQIFEECQYFQVGYFEKEEKAKDWLLH
jgi:hypothetical protein